MKAINTWTVAIFRYGVGIIQWRAIELKQFDITSRKTMTMYGRLHTKSGRDTLLVKRMEREIDLISMER